MPVEDFRDTSKWSLYSRRTRWVAHPPNLEYVKFGPLLLLEQGENAEQGTPRERVMWSKSKRMITPYQVALVSGVLLCQYLVIVILIWQHWYLRSIINRMKKIDYFKTQFRCSLISKLGIISIRGCAHLPSDNKDWSSTSLEWNRCKDVTICFKGS